MVFTTHALQKAADAARSASPRRFILALVLSLPPVTLLANDFPISEIHTRLQDNVYLLDAYIDYRLSDQVIEALNNGVPITLHVDIEIQRKRRWWLNADLATLQQRYRVRYHALSHQYLLQNINSGAFYPFHTLDGALESLGRLHDLPLLDRQLVEPDEEYLVHIHAMLDIEALPSPLRPLAYISPAWRLDSDWYTWSLKP